MSDYGVILFYTTSSVMKAEKLLLRGNYEVKLIPVPRELSSDCGIALRFNWDDKDRVVALLESEKIEVDGVYHLM